MSFDSIIAAAQTSVENYVGKSFTYSGKALAGVFSDGSESWTFDDFCQRNEVDLICVTSKAQWETNGVSPANRGVVTYASANYVIEAIRGSRTDDPCYHLALKRRT